MKFDPRWGGPASAQFDQLASWTTRPEPGIKYYSGTATYVKTFDLPAALRSTQQRNTPLPRPRPPPRAGPGAPERQGPRHRLGAAFPGGYHGRREAHGNALEVEVVNFWPNRIIGDQFLPPEQRFTRTNIRKLTKDTPLMESGLLGPVQLMEQLPTAEGGKQYVRCPIGSYLSPGCSCWAHAPPQGTAPARPRKCGFRQSRNLPGNPP